MNKVIIILVFFFSVFDTVGQNKPLLTQQTQFRLGFYHLGSYAKERPAFLIEHQFNYEVVNRFKLGVGIGVSLYPGALAYPVHIQGQYHFLIGKRKSYLSQDYGINLRLGANSFFSQRYTGGYHLIFNSHKKIEWITGLGYLYIWDNYGGKNISFLINVGILF
jgi:hypothetical protein